MEKHLLIHAFLISDNNGTLLVEVTKNETMEPALLSGFISALKVFGEGTLGNISNISIEGLDINMIIVSKFNLFMMAIIDSNIPELNLRTGCEETLKIFYQMFKDRFDSFDGDVTVFDKFTEILEAHVQHYLQALEEFVDVSDQARNILVQERDTLFKQVKFEPNLKKKRATQEKIFGISEKLKDEGRIKEIQNEIKKTESIIKDTKFKLQYFLDKAKTSLNEIISQYGVNAKQDVNFSQVYLNLFSFSSKLKTMIYHTGWKRYFNLASKIQNKEELSRSEFSEVIIEIQNLSENLDDYI